MSIFNIGFSMLSTLFGYFLSIAFLTSAYSDTMYSVSMKLFPLTTAIVIFLYLIYFGILTPLKIPAFSRSLRLINQSFSGEKLNEIKDDEQLKVLFRDLSFLPIYTTVSSVIFVIILGSLLVGLVVIEYFIYGSFPFQVVEDISKIGIVGFGVASIIAGMTLYLLADMLTSNERTTCFYELRKRGHDVSPITYIGINLKLSFFMVLIVLSLLTLGALIEKSRFFGEKDLILIIIYFGFSVIIGFILTYMNANSLLRVFTDIRRVAKDIASGGEVEFKVIPMEVELADIGYTILKMKGEIEEHRKNLEMKVEGRTVELQTALSDLKERDDLVQKQLDMASTIQRGLLPGRIDEWNGLKFSTRYIAMEKIGGDFFDVFQLGSDKLSLLIADVSGHGIPAALVTAMAKVSFGNAHMKFNSPERIFKDVNQDILDHVKTQDYLTCFILVIDDEYNVTYANASHQKAMLLRGESTEIELLDTGGLFIGAIEEANDTYEEKTIKLGYGDRIILYTDGIPEASNDQKVEYSNERLEEIVINNRDLPLEDFTDSIIEDLQKFMGNSVMQDDVTLIVVELEEEETIEITRKVKQLTKEKKYYEAIDLLHNGLELYPDNQKILYNLAKSYFRVNEFDKSIGIINKYINNEKNNKFAYYIGGTACFQMMDYKNAIEFYEQALRLDPNFLNALLAAGIAYKKSSMRDDAARCFTRVLDIEGDNKRAQLELNELKSADSV